jgi:mono/diheme cytochrome c family protein
MKKLIVVITMSMALFGATGKELFEQKCTSCHSITPPTTHEEIKKFVAPPIGNVLFHLDKEFQSANEIKNHIINFTMNPTKEKAICRSVKRFGLMPSQKDNVNEQQLDKIAEFLVSVIAYSKNSQKNQNSCKSGGCSSKSAKGCSTNGACGNCNTK